MVRAQECSQNVSLMPILTMYFYTHPYMSLFTNFSYIYVKDGVFISIYLYIFLTLTLCTPKQAVCTQKHALNHLLPAPRAINPCVQPERRKHHRWLRPQHVPAAQLLPLN